MQISRRRSFSSWRVTNIILDGLAAQELGAPLTGRQMLRVINTAPGPGAVYIWNDNTLGAAKGIRHAGSTTHKAGMVLALTDNVLSIWFNSVGSIEPLSIIEYA